MRYLVILCLVVLGGCVEPADDLKTCASLGCPLKPSGTPDIWTPCTDDVCWCWDEHETQECLATESQGDGK